MQALRWDLIHDEAVRYLSSLIKFDTSNPPGNELPAAHFLRDILAREGIEAQVVESSVHRGNLIARLRGAGEARPLLLLSHLDVVPADAAEWSFPPFAGDVVAGEVRGRGALDCKFLTVIQLMTMLLLKREGARLKRDVILAATADEEAGGKLGLGWLALHHRQLLECEYAINEGGGVGVVLGGRRHYVCQTAEKGNCWLRIRAQGRASHAALPRPDNPAVIVARAVERMSRTRMEMRATNTTKEFVRVLARSQRFPASLLGRGLLNRWLFPILLPHVVKDSTIANMLYAMLHDTATPTVIRSGAMINVVPSTAEAEIDGRMLPGQTSERFIRQVRKALGNAVDIEVSLDAPGYEIDPDDELFRAIQAVVVEEDPGSVVVPFMLAAGTDSKYLAAAGVRVYGFAPMRQSPDIAVTEMIHGRDERVSVENVLFGTRVLYNIVRRFCC
ncbi:MAG: M20/M25/M40 family metallo-hydrolase [Chloroflexi bacterium]|nr:M20/M25/M40 family metallo-hydrolase [Chloroflexota bacterium]